MSRTVKVPRVMAESVGTRAFSLQQYFLERSDRQINMQLSLKEVCEHPTVANMDRLMDDVRSYVQWCAKQEGEMVKLVETDAP